MNTKLIFRLSFLGLVMAVATVFWISPKAEPFFWLIIFIICAYIIARECSKRYFLHGFLVSMLNSVYITAAHIYFYQTYISNHPDEMNLMNAFPLPYSPRVTMLMVGPAFGIGFGIILGIFAFVASKIVHRKVKHKSKN